jgi:hypothetical protein
MYIHCFLSGVCEAVVRWCNSLFETALFLTWNVVSVLEYWVCDRSRDGGELGSIMDGGPLAECQRSPWEI